MMVPEFRSDSGCTAKRLDVSGPITNVPALVGVSRGKLILVSDDDLTYCSLRLDERSLQTALNRITPTSPSRCRAGVVGLGNDP